MNTLERQGFLRGSSRDLMPGVTAFLTSAYLLFLIPGMVADAGAPIAEATTAFALVAATGSLVMGFLANKPLLVAPGIGTTVYLVYIVVLGGSLSLAAALAAAFCAGVVFLLLATIGLHHFLYQAIPVTIRLAFVVGIGLFLVIIGLRSAGLLIYEAATAPRLGDLTQPLSWLALGGLGLIGLLLRLRVSLALLLGLLFTTILVWGFGLAPPPQTFVSVPVWPETLLFSLSFSEVFTRPFLVAFTGLFFLLILDVTGTLAGLERLGENAEVFASKSSYSVVAGTSALGALFGMSPSVVLLESAVGLQSGGRGGGMAVVAGVLFALALFFTPVFAAVPAAATAPLIVTVGLMMMSGAKAIAWRSWYQAVPALITTGAMAVTLNIAQGLALGMLAYVACLLLAGRGRTLHRSTYLLTAGLALYLLLYS